MLSFLLLIFCLSAIGFYGYAVFSAADHFSRVPEVDPRFHPPVTLLKPIQGVDGNTYANLASFCRQDYPEYQIIFGVRDPQDPCMCVIRQIIRDFPHLDIRLITDKRDVGANPKVNNLIHMEAHARHSLLAISDGDIRVGKDYLTQIVQPMRDPAVGAVTCLYRSLSKGWIGTIEALRESTEFCPQVLVARALQGMRFALGSTIVVKREALERIGGFGSIVDYLSDDFMLGSLIQRAGFQVVLSKTVVEHELSIWNFRDLARRQIRWNRGIHCSRPWGYRGLLMTYGIPMSLLFLWVGGGSLLSWAVWGATWAARLAMAYAIGVRCLADRASKRFLWLVPLQDGVSFVFWVFGLVRGTVYWHGQGFGLTKKGTLIPLSPKPEMSLVPPVHEVRTDAGLFAAR